MGKLDKNILGDVSGTVGNVSFSSWKGTNIAKSIGSPTGDPTLKQTAVRERFGAYSKLNKAFGTITKDSFSSMSQNQTTYNAFMSVNKDVVTIVPTLDANNEWTGYSINQDFTKLIVSKGSYFKAQNPIAALDGTDTKKVNFTWEFGAGYKGLATDKVYCVVYCPDLEDTTVLNFDRSALTGSITVPNTYSGKQCQAFIYVSDKEKKNYSESNYIGVVAPV